MSEKSKIEWTDSTWNPVTGCTKISPGCDNCYALRMTNRLHAMGQQKYSKGFKVTEHGHELERPNSWKKPRKVFVNSMSDLFHRDVSDSFIIDVFKRMNISSSHQFQVLTKRAKRMASLGAYLPWTYNISAGVSVENSDYIKRIEFLHKTPANTKFISIEPMLGPLPDLDLDGIDWVIVGGESGPGARSIQAAWVRDIREQCLRTKTLFMFKQWGGVNKNKTGRLLDGRTWDDTP